MSTSPDERHPKSRLILALLAVIALVGVGLFVGTNIIANNSAATDPRCVATSESGKEFTFDPEQSSYAALIGAQSIAHGLDHRAAVVALATAEEESGFENLEYGDLDSVGLFQQRPSQGWGSVEEIMDPHYAASVFYNRLPKIGYESMSVTEAAQQTLGNGTPGGYSKHEDSATALADAFTGARPASFTCTPVTVEAEAAEVDEAFDSPLKALVYSVEQDFEGKAGTVREEGQNAVVEPENDRTGWAAAHWAVANSDMLNIMRVSHQGQVWDRSRQVDDDAPGWEPVENVFADGEKTPVASQVVMSTPDHTE